VTGAVADHLGLQIGLGLQVLVVVITIPIALLLPSEAMLGRLRSHPAAASPAGLAASDLAPRPAGPTVR
jgi:hypothetical protein